MLLSTYGSRGDVEPLAGLAAELRRLGAEVRVCAPPDGDFERRLADVGVALVPVGVPARVLTRSAPPPSALPERAAEVIADQFETVAAAAEGCDVLVATGMMPAAAGALSVAELLGIRSVSVTFQQLTLPSPDRAPLAYPGHPFPPGATDNGALWRLDAGINNELFAAALGTSRTAAGLPPVDDVRGYVTGRRPWLATDPVLDPWRRAPGFTDPDFDVVQTGAWFVPGIRRLPSELLAFLAAGPPPVYVGFGSMPVFAAADVTRAALAAVRAHGRRVVMARGWADLEALDDRDDCFVVGEVDQGALFPLTAAVVHHGGAGTTAAATRSGVPQVVLPQAADQPYWAGRVAELGIGVDHGGPVPTADSLSAALATALDPVTRALAEAVAAEIRTDGAAVAARLLLDTSG
ncbi:glycosyltransferase [Streptomyces sp. NPDC020875]|uniref:glycosyltransferase n=1 Tax=Streptomyces sp. NPDC020875 TaxID=3154898 RepID=UPI0034037224